MSKSIFLYSVNLEGWRVWLARPLNPVITEKFRVLREMLNVILDEEGQFGWWEQKLYILPAEQDDDEPLFFLKFEDGIVLIFGFTPHGMLVTVDSAMPLSINWLNLFDQKVSSSGPEGWKEFFGKDAYAYNHNKFSLWLWNSTLFSTFIYLLRNRTR